MQEKSSSTDTTEPRWVLYTLFDSRFPDEVRYVGITCDPRKRLSSHRRPKPDDKAHRAHWARSVTANGGDVMMNVVSGGMPLEAAKSAEVSAISERRQIGTKLVNSSDGGDGVLEFSPETRARISASQVARLADPAVRRRMSESAAGKTPSAETRALLSRALSGVPRTAEAKANISAGKMGKPVAESVRRKISATLKGRKQPADLVARRAASNRGKVLSAEHKQQVSKAARLRRPKDGKFKGVVASGKRWVARIGVDGVDRYLGTFDTAEAAAMAYDKAATEAWGGEVWLNFPRHESLAA